MENFFNDEIEKTVFISDEQLQEAIPGKLYGKYFEDTKIYNIFPSELSNKGDYLGELLPAGSTPTNDFCGIIGDGNITFFCDGKEIHVESYGLYQSIFSRNKGILETSVMNTKRVVNSALIWVMPYLTAEFRDNEDSFRDYYDEIEICEQAATTHYKSAFQIRNRVMADRSDLVILYVEHPSGGAYQTFRYVQKSGKKFINLAAEE